ncbi:MAG: S8 family serine peptidase [Flavobacteriaceae bacterium]|nr:S8 family serine peptidase [Flavobacteriaceae bacterium]
MLQIVHDVAPGAKLAFHTGVLSPRNFELAIQSLQAANCDIIVDDITFPLEPFFGTGRIADAIKSFTSEPGNLYFTSAGNFANDGYQAAFSSSAATPTSNFLPAGSRAHVFGTTSGVQDVIQKISVEPGVYMIVLQWDESLASQENASGAITDLDIFLVDDNRNLIVGNNRVNQAGDPTEVIVFEAKASGTANILISSANGAPPAGLAFRYVAFRSQGLKVLEYAGAPTVSGHAMTPEANTIAAIDYRAALSPVPQYFSSYAGNLADNTILEIDLAAPDGGNTNVASIGQDIAADDDTFPNFFGTSAAAPHAAGAFALLMSAIPNWYPNGLPGDIVVKTNAAADEALKLVKQTATPAGTQERSGVGLINLEAAFTTIAAKTAKVTKLIVEDGKTPSAEPFSVTIIGEFFPTDPKIIFDGKELEITSKSATEIVAKVGTFSGNPALQVQTNSLPGSINNGGLSDPISFFSDGKLALNIIAEDVDDQYTARQ